MILLVLWCFISVLETSSSKNLLVIQIENIGWSDLGVYSPWQQDTPHIDILARSSVVLDNLYSETSSSASQASYFTGMLPASWGFYSSNNAETTEIHEDSSFTLPSFGFTLPQKILSYDSKFIGRWYLGQRPEANPLNYGFKHFYGHVSDRSSKYDNLRYPNPGLYRDSRIFARFFGRSDDPVIGKIEDRISDLTKVYFQEAKALIYKALSRNNSFYVHCSLDALSHPSYRSEEFVNSSNATRATDFGDALRETDDFVGKLVNLLSSSAVLNNTVIALFAGSTAQASIFNGGLNSPFTGETGDSTEGGVRVPGIIRIPTKVSHYRSQQVMTLADLHHTLLALVSTYSGGCTDASPCIKDGKDFSRNLVKGSSDERIVPIYLGRTLMAVRAGRYKAHQYSISKYVPGQFLDSLTSYKLRNITNFPIVYDIVTDPSERFFIGDGYGSSSPRNKDEVLAALGTVQAAMKPTITGGLLNECNTIYREWSPPGCAVFALCLPPPESKLEMCIIPSYYG